MFTYIEIEATYGTSEQYKVVDMSDFWPYDGKEIVDLLCYELYPFDHLSSGTLSVQFFSPFDYNGSGFVYGKTHSSGGLVQLPNTLRFAPIGKKSTVQLNFSIPTTSSGKVKIILYVRRDGVAY